MAGQAAAIETLREANDALRAAEARSRSGFSPQDYRKIAALLHPDRWPYELKRQAQEAFCLFSGVEKEKTDDAVQQAKRDAEMRAARKATRERNSARGKAAWAKQKPIS